MHNAVHGGRYIHSLSPSTKSCIGKQSFACSPASQRLKAGSGLSRHGQGKQPKNIIFWGESPKYGWDGEIVEKQREEEALMGGVLH